MIASRMNSVPALEDSAMGVAADSEASDAERPAPEKPRRRAGKSSYAETFLSPMVVQRRTAVYVSEQVRDAISTIVRHLGPSGELSVSGYVENVLRHLLHLPRRRKDSSSEASPAVTLPAADSSDGQLIERKVYTSCQRVPESDMAAKTASNASAGDNFEDGNSPRGGSVVETWSAESFRGISQWNDEGFALNENQESLSDTERIRQEVQQALSRIPNEEDSFADELEPTDEEKYGPSPDHAGSFF